MKKYEFTGETKTVNSLLRTVTYRRIRAKVAFGIVEAGEVGGWIEKEENLSDDGDAWVFGSAEVSGDAKVYDDAWVSGNAKVSGNANVFGNAKVYGDAWVFGSAEVYGDAKVYDDAWVSGNAKVSGNAEVSGNAKVLKTTNIFVIGPAGSRNAYTTFYRDKDNEISVRCGCFCGKLDKFLRKVSEIHGANKYALVYQASVELAKMQIELKE